MATPDSLSAQISSAIEGILGSGALGTGGPAPAGQVAGKEAAQPAPARGEEGKGTARAGIPLPSSGYLSRLLTSIKSTLGALPGAPVMAAGVAERNPLTVVKGISELVGSIFRNPHEEVFEGALSQHSGVPGAALLAKLMSGATARTQKVMGFAKGGTVKEPGDTDTVPAMLTPGEVVVPKEDAHPLAAGLGALGEAAVTKGGKDSASSEAIAEAIDDLKDLGDQITLGGDQLKELNDDLILLAEGVKNTTRPLEELAAEIVAVLEAVAVAATEPAPAPPAPPVPATYGLAPEPKPAGTPEVPLVRAAEPTYGLAPAAEPAPPTVPLVTPPGPIYGLKDKEKPAPSLSAPLPVTIVGAASPGGPPVPGGAPPGGPSPAATRATFAGLVDTVKQFGAASTMAFGMAAASLGGLARAASPALFATFTQSAQLLAATLGNALVGPVLTLSFKLQELANWVRNLDPALKATIGSWIGWGMAALGAATALSRLISLGTSLLPILTGLKAALVFTVANPFGAILAGLAAMAVMRPEMFKEIGSTFASLGNSLAGILGPALQQARGLLEAFAGVASTLLVPVLKVVAATLEAIGNVLSWLAGLLGGTTSSILTFVAAFVILLGPARLLVAGLTALGPALTALRVGLSATAASFSLTATASTAFKAAASWLVGGGLPVVIAAAAAAVYLLADAFKYSAKEAAAAAASIDKIEATGKRISKTGTVTTKDVLDVLSPEERKAYNTSKTDDERKKVLEAAQGKAKRDALGTIPEEDRGKVETALEMAVKAGKEKWTASGKSSEFSKTLQKELIEGGMSGDAVQALSKQFATGPAKKIIAEMLSPSGTVDATSLKKLFDALKLPTAEAGIKKTVLEKALGGGLAEEVKEAGDFDTPRAKRLKGLRGIAGVAFQKDMEPQQMDVAQFRSVIQNMNLSMNPIEQRIYEEQVKTNKLMEIYVWEQLKLIAKNTGR